MKSKAQQNREQIENIKFRLALGQISYQEAKAEAEPIINQINQKAVEIAQRFGMRAKKISFQELMR